MKLVVVREIGGQVFVYCNGPVTRGGRMPGPVTQLLIKWSDGDQAAMNQLVPLVYAELRRMAASHIRREQPEHSLQATALVHEAFLRMVDYQRVSLTGRDQ